MRTTGLFWEGLELSLAKDDEIDLQLGLARRRAWCMLGDGPRRGLCR